MKLIPETKLQRIVIVGGGFGGITLAKKLNKKKFQVVMIDRNNYHTFQPLLYQVATGGLEPDSIAYPIRKIFPGKQNIIFRVAEALEAKINERVLVTDLGDLQYDHLVIANGSTTNFFGNQQIEQQAMTLKNVTGALDLRSLLLQNFEKVLIESDAEKRQKLMNIVIAGGGPTGVEIAGALAELKRHVLPNDYPELDTKEVQIHVIESSDQVLSSMSDQSSVKAKKFLEKMGVNIWLKTLVTEYRDEKVYLGNGKTIDCSAFIWTAGVKGNAIKGFPPSVFTEKGSRMKVDVYNRVTGIESLFAIGDAAAIIDEAHQHPHPMLAPVAIQQAKNLAHNLNISDNEKWKRFHYFDKGSMATVGKNKAVADLGAFHFQGFFAWLVWMFIHLMSIAGFRNRLIILINWVWNYFSYDRAIRLIIRPYKKKNGTQ